MAVRAVYIPPFAKDAKDGAPEFLRLVQCGRVARHPQYGPDFMYGPPAPGVLVGLLYGPPAHPNLLWFVAGGRLMRGAAFIY
jgi:hypothetical protein